MATQIWVNIGSDKACSPMAPVDYLANDDLSQVKLDSLAFT